MKVSALLNKFAINASWVNKVKLIDGSNTCKDIPFNIVMQPKNKEYSHYEYLNANVEVFFVKGSVMTIAVKGVYEV